MHSDESRPSCGSGISRNLPGGMAGSDSPPHIDLGQRPLETDDDASLLIVSGSEAPEGEGDGDEHEEGQESTSTDVETEYEYGAPIFGSPGETRFFLLKSTQDFIDESKKDGLWVTQESTGSKLTSAFRSGSRVILFFSANGSDMFQGYAKMESIPFARIAPRGWRANRDFTQLDFTPIDPFRVTWYCKYPVRFQDMQRIWNSLNAMSCVQAVDGQEYSDMCGREMVQQIEELYETHRAAFDPPFPRD